MTLKKHVIVINENNSFSSQNLMIKVKDENELFLIVIRESEYSFYFSIFKKKQ